MSRLPVPPPPSKSDRSGPCRDDDEATLLLRLLVGLLRSTEAVADLFLDGHTDDCECPTCPRLLGETWGDVATARWIARNVSSLVESGIVPDLSLDDLSPGDALRGLAAIADRIIPAEVVADGCVHVREEGGVQ